MGLPPVAIAAGISGLFSAFGQSAANKANRDLSNTSYQRGMADMKKAGLNPILAYQKGGASTPDMKSVTKDLPQSVASAVQALRAKSEIDNIKSQTALATEKLNTEKSQQNALNTNSALTAERINTQLHITDKAGFEIDKVMAEVGIATENWTVAQRAAALATIEARIDKSTYGKTILWLKRLKDLPGGQMLTSLMGKRAGALPAINKVKPKTRYKAGGNDFSLLE